MLKRRDGHVIIVIKFFGKYFMHYFSIWNEDLGGKKERKKEANSITNGLIGLKIAAFLGYKLSKIFVGGEVIRVLKCFFLIYRNLSGLNGCCTYTRGVTPKRRNISARCAARGSSIRMDWDATIYLIMPQEFVISF